ncbi:MAG: anti-sigma factor, partial [Planctomycetota bacterium]
MVRRPEQDERLADWVDGRLSKKDRERLEAEFGVNPELKAAAGEYRKMVEAVRGELQRTGDEPDMSDRIMSGLDSRPAGAGERR